MKAYVIIIPELALSLASTSIGYIFEKLQLGSHIFE